MKLGTEIFKTSEDKCVKDITEILKNLYEKEHQELAADKSFTLLADSLIDLFIQENDKVKFRANPFPYSQGSVDLM